MRLLLIAFAVGLSASVVFGQAHNAHWYNQEAHTGRFSVIVNVPDGTEAIVAVAREKGVNLMVMNIDELTFQRKVLNCSPPMCFPPSVLLGIDKDMNGRYEADDFAWQWSLARAIVIGDPAGADPALLHGDTFIQCENVASLTGPDLAFVPVNVRDSYACYGPNILGTGYGFVPYAPGNLGTAYETGGGVVDGISPTDIVRALKVLAGGSSSWMNFSALVDAVTMSGSTRIDEPNNSRSHFEVVTSR